MVIKSSVSSDGRELTISVEGRFDFNSSELFRNAYKDCQYQPKHYVIDLARSDYLDSSALGMLLALRDHAKGDGSDIRIVNCPADIKKIFSITKLDGLFTIE